MNILDLQPTAISKDLKGKYICIYSKPKLGKTTMASQFPNNLLAAFEMGYNALGGIIAAPIVKWTEFKDLVSQLRKEEAKQRFKTISIDTVAIAWEKCEEYICQQNSVTSIGDIPWGKGYDLCKKEFANTFRTITMLGYGLVFIAHEEVKTIKNEKGEDVEVIAPSIPKRAYEIVNAMVDIIGYIAEKDVDGKQQRVMYTRATPTLVAGSRFKYMSPMIPFGYDELVKELNEAIEKSEKLDGITITNDEVRNFAITSANRPFEATMAEAGELWNSIINMMGAEMGPILTGIVETYFGSPIKLSTATEKQQDLVEMVILDMRKLLQK